MKSILQYTVEIFSTWCTLGKTELAPWAKLLIPGSSNTSLGTDEGEKLVLFDDLPTLMIFVGLEMKRFPSKQRDGRSCVSLERCFGSPPPEDFAYWRFLAFCYVVGFQMLCALYKSGSQI